MAGAAQKGAERRVKAQRSVVAVATMGGVEAGTIIAGFLMAAVQNLERAGEKVMCG